MLFSADPGARCLMMDPMRSTAMIATGDGQLATSRVTDAERQGTVGTGRLQSEGNVTAVSMEGRQRLWGPPVLGQLELCECGVEPRQPEHRC